MQFQSNFYCHVINRILHSWERSGAEVESLTRDRRAAGSSLTDVTVLWSLSKTHLSLLSTRSTQEESCLYNLKIVDGTSNRQILHSWSHIIEFIKLVSKILDSFNKFNNECSFL